jgi:hypothetical protein
MFKYYLYLPYKNIFILFCNKFELYEILYLLCETKKKKIIRQNFFHRFIYIIRTIMNNYKYKYDFERIYF